MNLTKWVFECREISETDKNKECPVTMDIINIDEKYCQCSQCEYNIKENVIKTMFNKTNNVKCPMCRLQWQKKIVYFNSNKHNTFVIEEKLIEQDETWKKICVELNWEFIPTV